MLVRRKDSGAGRRRVIEQVIGLARHLVDAVGSTGRSGCASSTGKWSRPRHRSGACWHGRCGSPARAAAELEQRERRLGIGAEIAHRVRDRVHVARAGGEVEDRAAAGDERRHAGAVAQIRDLDSHARAEGCDVGLVAAALGIKRVDDRHLGAERHESPRQRRADKAQSARHQHARALVGGFEIAGHRMTSSIMPS